MKKRLDICGLFRNMKIYEEDIAFYDRTTVSTNGI